MSLPLHVSNIKGTVNVSQTAAGSTQGTATAMLADHVLVASVTAGTGIILPAATPLEIFTVANGDSGDALLVYPPTGGKINNAAANAALSLAAGRGAIFIALDATNWTAIYS